MCDFQSARKVKRGLKRRREIRRGSCLYKPPPPPPPPQKKKKKKNVILRVKGVGLQILSFILGISGAADL
ncbi:hypothetical protein Hanom_Chr10g00923981 [Helianthus anomalus]